MIFDLADDFTQALEAMPREHPRHCLVALAAEAMRCDVQFIARHHDDYPQALFQCLWNSGWWYDCPDAAKHCKPVETNRPVDGTPGRQMETKLYELMESWRQAKQSATPGFRWVRTLRPPPSCLGTPITLVLSGHRGGVHGVAISADGRFVASGSGNDRSVRLWDAETGRELTSMEFPAGARAEGRLPSPDRHYEVVVDSFVRIHFRDATREPAVTVPTDTSTENAVYSPDGRMRAVVNDDTIVVRHLADSRAVYCRGHQANETIRDRLDGPDDPPEIQPLKICRVVFSPDSRRVVSVSEDKSVRTWDATSGDELNRSHLSCRPHRTVLSPTGDHLAIMMSESMYGPKCGPVEIHDLRTTADFSLGYGNVGRVTCVAFSSGSNRICTGDEDGTLQVWDTERCVELNRIVHAHHGRVESIAFFPDGERIASASTDGTIRIWRALERGEERKLVGNVYYVEESWREAGTLFTRSGLQRVGSLSRPRSEDTRSDVADVAFSPDGTRIVSASGDGTAWLWDVLNEIPPRCLQTHKAAVTCVAYSPDGRRIATGSRDRTVQLWHPHSGYEAGHKTSHRSPVVAVAFSADGTCVASHDFNGSIAIRGCRQGNANHHLSVDSNELAALPLAFSQNGKLLACAKANRTIEVFDTRTGTRLHSLSGDDEYVTRLAFSADEKSLIGESTKGTVLQWDAITGERLQALEGSVQFMKLARGDRYFGWRASSDGVEVKIEDVEKTLPSAWFPVVSEKFWSHPSGPLWAVAASRHLYLLRLEDSDAWDRARLINPMKFGERAEPNDLWIVDSDPDLLSNDVTKEVHAPAPRPSIFARLWQKIWAG